MLKFFQELTAMRYHGGNHPFYHLFLSIFYSSELTRFLLDHCFLDLVLLSNSKMYFSSFNLCWRRGKITENWFCSSYEETRINSDHDYSLFINKVLLCSLHSHKMTTWAQSKAKNYSQSVEGWPHWCPEITHLMAAYLMAGFLPGSIPITDSSSLCTSIKCTFPSHSFFL